MHVPARQPASAEGGNQALWIGGSGDIAFRSGTRPQAPGPRRAAPPVRLPLLAERRSQLLRLLARRSSCQAGLVAAGPCGKPGRQPATPHSGHAAEPPHAAGRWATLAGCSTLHMGTLTWVRSAPHGGCGGAPQAPAAAVRPGTSSGGRVARTPGAPQRRSHPRSRSLPAMRAAVRPSGTLSPACSRPAIRKGAVVVAARGRLGGLALQPHSASPASRAKHQQAFLQHAPEVLSKTAPAQEPAGKRRHKVLEGPHLVAPMVGGRRCVAARRY